MASLEWSPTTTKKLRFFSWMALRISAGMRESLQALVNMFKGKGNIMGLTRPLSAFCRIRATKMTSDPFVNEQNRRDSLVLRI